VRGAAPSYSRNARVPPFSNPGTGATLDLTVPSQPLEAE
jgi:hypothetical protein